MFTGLSMPLLDDQANQVIHIAYASTDLVTMVKVEDRANFNGLHAAADKHYARRASCTKSLT
jgi:hypothetical protein